MGLSRFLGTPTFPTFSSRDVEGGLAAVASPPPLVLNPPFSPGVESSVRGAGHVPRLSCCGAVNTAQPKAGGVRRPGPARRLFGRPKHRGQRAAGQKNHKRRALTHPEKRRAASLQSRPGGIRDSLRREASQAATRLLRCATAPRVTAPLGCGSGVWYGRKVPFRPVHTARMLRFLGVVRCYRTLSNEIQSNCVIRFPPFPS